MALSPSVRIDVTGARGESQADVLRRTGMYGVLPGDTDEQAIAKVNAAAEAAADAAATSAAYAEEFSGPAYATISAGQAATTTGQFFRVPVGTTPETYIRYQRTSGGSIVVAQLATTSALAAPTGAGLIGTTDGVLQEVIDDLQEASSADTQNLFRNTDFSQGNPNNLLVPNDALDVVGLTNWVAQQTGLNPFVSVQRGLNADGLYSIRMINGLPSVSSVAIGTGTKVFTVAAGLNFAPDIDVIAAYSEDPINKKMTGTVVSYSGTTLTLNITSVTGSGTFASWYIGRSGVTAKATPVYNTTTASAAATTKILTFTSTATIEVGANVESGTGGPNGIAKATYVAKILSATQVELSQPIISPGVTIGQQITTYGDQGWYLYQNINPADAGGFKMGTPDARTSFLSFKVKSRFVTGQASVMALGYSSLYTLGRSYAAPFAVTTTETVVTVPIVGDTAVTAGTWLSGYDATDWPYLGVGFTWVSRGTASSKNIAPYAWSSDFAVAGATGQTLDLASVVGAWVEVSEVQFGFSAARKYFAPTTVQAPTPVVHVRAPQAPRVIYEATRNAFGLRKVQSYVDAFGSLVDQRLADDELSGAILRSLDTNGNQNVAGVYEVGGTQVVTSRQPAVTAPTGGSTIDSQSRTAIAAVIARLQAHGLIS